MELINLDSYKLYLKSGKLLFKANLKIDDQNTKLVVLKAPNGTGKSRFFENILGIDDSTYNEGNASILGLNKKDLIYSESIKDLVVYIEQESRFFTDNDKAEGFYSGICFLSNSKFDVSRLDKLLSYFYKTSKDLKEFKNKRIFKLSGGEKKILQICAMIAAKEKAKLYIIDEPLNNLEINKIKIFSNFIRQQIIEGKRFLISSHLSLFPFPDLNLTIKEYNLVKIDNSFDKCLGEIDDLGFYKEVEWWKINL